MAHATQLASNAEIFPFDDAIMETVFLHAVGVTARSVLIGVAWSKGMLCPIYMKQVHIAGPWNGSHC